MFKVRKKNTILVSFKFFLNFFYFFVGAFKRFVNLKQKAPGIKTLIAIGGWNEGGARFSSVVANDGIRATFVKNVVAFVQKFGFDGFDLDWEYPGNTERGGHPEDVVSQLFAISTNIVVSVTSKSIMIIYSSSLTITMKIETRSKLVMLKYSAPVQSDQDTILIRYLVAAQFHQAHQRTPCRF